MTPPYVEFLFHILLVKHFVWCSLFGAEDATQVLCYFSETKMLMICFQCGVIECVPDSKSRDQIGKQTDISLDQYFVQKYGDQDSPKFQEVAFHRTALFLFGTLVLLNPDMS